MLSMIFYIFLLFYFPFQKFLLQFGLLILIVLSSFLVPAYFIIVQLSYLHSFFAFLMPSFHALQCFCFFFLSFLLLLFFPALLLPLLYLSFFHNNSNDSLLTKTLAEPGSFLLREVWEVVASFPGSPKEHAEVKERRGWYQPCTHAQVLSRFLVNCILSMHHPSP